VKDLTVRETGFLLVAIFFLFCWMSNDDLQQAELAQNLAAQVRSAK